MRWRLKGALAAGVAAPLAAAAVALLLWAAGPGGQPAMWLSGGLALGALLAGAAGWALARPLAARLGQGLEAARRLSAAGFTGEATDRPVLRPRLGEPAEVWDLVVSLDSAWEALSGRIHQLRSERDRLLAVLEAMTEGVVLVDTAGRIQAVNPAFLRLLGREPRFDPQGRTLLSVLRAEPVDDALRTALGGEPVRFREVALNTRPPRTMVLTAAPYPGHPDSPVLGAVVVLRDVTERRRLERVRQDFVANASHELKTPLAAVLGSAETLEDAVDDDPEAARSFARTIQQHARRMQALVEDLLDLATLEAGAYPLERHVVAPARVVSEVVAQLTPAAEARGVTLDARVPLELPELVCDERALGQVLVNLVDNAIRHGRAGGRVRIRAEVEERTLRLHVADDGPGIPAHARERVFERFYRVDPGRSRDRGGTGLGLSIVRHLVERMGGEVRLSCPAEGGAVFSVSLPLQSPSTSVT